ncbi:phosphotransferase [Kitasatospora sp. NBC_00374]|uniref:phosphotransferase n=1 Tax=Kitasatospora sp. NBC_00374 TaxID=2975964 RepID=UPI00352BEC67
MTSPRSTRNRHAPVSGSPRPELWCRAVELIRRESPAHRGCLLHRDFHPGDVLFAGPAGRPRITGVVDVGAPVLAAAGRTGFSPRRGAGGRPVARTRPDRPCRPPADRPTGGVSAAAPRPV